MGEEFESGSFKPAKFEQALIAAAERFVPTSEKAEKMCRTQRVSTATEDATSNFRARGLSVFRPKKIR